MKDYLEYKGYHTKVVFDAESCTVRGKIEGIKDYVDFETSNLKEAEKEFRAAVDDYLEFCEELGVEPDKEYRGSFNVRIAPELHRQLAMTAAKEGVSLNAAVEKAVSEYLNKDNSFTSKIAELKEAIDNVRIQSFDMAQRTNSSISGGNVSYGIVYDFESFRKQEVCN